MPKRLIGLDRNEHLEEYEDLYFNKKWRISDIRKYAKLKYNDNTSKSTFYRWFNRRDKARQYLLQANKLRDKQLKEEVFKEIKIAKDLTENLEIYRNKIKEKINSIAPSDEKLLQKYLRDATYLAELLLKFSDKINIDTTTEDDIWKRLQYAIESLPVEYIDIIDKRWDEWEEKR